MNHRSETTREKTGHYATYLGYTNDYKSEIATTQQPTTEITFESVTDNVIGQQKC